MDKLDLETTMHTYRVEFYKKSWLTPDEENARNPKEEGIWLVYGEVRAASRMTALHDVAYATGCKTRIADEPE